MILDACCGHKLMYHGLNLTFSETELVYVDRRLGDFPNQYGHWPDPIRVRPTVCADLSQLPFRDHLFSVIVFDPPQMESSLSSWMQPKYGTWTNDEAIVTCHQANEEFSRCLRPEGLLLAKTLAAPSHRSTSPARIRSSFTHFKPLLDISFRSESRVSQARTHWIVLVQNNGFEMKT